jgi:hypothetical protein
MGAATGVQVRRNAVIVAASNPVTSTDVSDQNTRWGMPSVRIEGVRGSNPLSSTEFLQVRWPVRFLALDWGADVGAKS